MPKKRRSVCEKCQERRKTNPRIGRPCPECGSICGCDWHEQAPKGRRRKTHA